MTIQISNRYRFRGDEYSVEDSKGKGYFSPETLGLNPVMISTACRRGYHAAFGITEHALVLTDLTVRDQDEKYPVLDGFRPKLDHGTATYRGLHLVVPFTGTLRIVKCAMEFNALGDRPLDHSLHWVIQFESGQVVAIRDFNQYNRRLGVDPQTNHEVFVFEGKAGAYIEARPPRPKKILEFTSWQNDLVQKEQLVTYVCSAS